MTPTTRVRLLVPRLNGKPGDEGVISCKWKNGGYMVKFESKNPDKPVVRHCYEYEIEAIDTPEGSHLTGEVPPAKKAGLWAI